MKQAFRRHSAVLAWLATAIAGAPPVRAPIQVGPAIRVDVNGGNLAANETSLAGMTTQGMNRYVYVQNDPVNISDPDGRNPFLAGLIVAFAVVAVGYAGMFALAAVLGALLGLAGLLAGIEYSVCYLLVGEDGYEAFLDFFAERLLNSGLELLVSTLTGVIVGIVTWWLGAAIVTALLVTVLVDFAMWAICAQCGDDEEAGGGIESTPRLADLGSSHPRSHTRIQRSLGVAHC